MEAVDELAPKGSTPLTKAVLNAADQLDYTANQATIILVSDGAETRPRSPKRSPAW